MRAVGYARTGGPEVLEPVEVPTPEPGHGQVLIKVAYAGVNFAEIMLRRGEFGAPDGITVPGLEVSGEVAELGAGVTGLSVGQPVAGLTHTAIGATGGYAEYAVVPAGFVYPLGEVDLASGAALPCVVTTAYALLTRANLTADETVLIHGAAGAVGSVAGQIARALGAGTVLGTVGSAAKLGAPKGYDRVLLRADFAAELGPDSVDIALDGVGGPTREASLDVLKPLGRLVVFGNAGSFPDAGISSARVWRNTLSVVGYAIGPLATTRPDVVRAQALAARDLLRDGQVRIEISDILPLTAAAEAHRSIESGASQGKLLLRM